MTFYIFIHVADLYMFGCNLLDFSQALGIVPHSILLDNLSNCELNRFMPRWVMNWLKDRV